MAPVDATEWAGLAFIIVWALVLAILSRRKPLEPQWQPFRSQSLGRFATEDTVLPEPKKSSMKFEANPENAMMVSMLPSSSTGLLTGAWIIYLYVALFLNFEKAIPLTVVTMICLTTFTISSGKLSLCVVKTVNALLLVGVILYGFFYSYKEGYPGLIPYGDQVFTLEILVTLCVFFGMVYLASPLQPIPRLKDLIILIGFLFMALYILRQILNGFIDDAKVGQSRLQAALGAFVFAGACITLSTNRPGIPWQVVASGILVMFYLGLFVLGSDLGRNVFQSVGGAVGAFLDFSDEGAQFVFGENFRTVFFAFKVMPTTVFFSAFTSALFYLGVLQVVVRACAAALDATVGTSLVQSVNAAANLFLGQTEAPLLVKPFLGKASPSDIHCVMVGGFASIAGGVMAAYIGIGIEADQLLGSSVMSVPGTLVVANLLVPPGSYPEEEVEEEVTDLTEQEGTPQPKKTLEFPPVKESNVIEAAGNGAVTAVMLTLTISAMLIAFISLITLLNLGLGYLGSLVNIAGLTFESICGVVLWPLAWLLGTEPSECFTIASLIGTKVFINEFVAFEKLAVLTGKCTLCDGTRLISERGELIATYSLCSFANVGSIGVTLGGLGTLCPSRSSLFAKVVTKAMICGNVVCFFRCCFAAIILG